MCQNNLVAFVSSEADFRAVILFSCINANFTHWNLHKLFSVFFNSNTSSTWTSSAASGARHGLQTAHRHLQPLHQTRQLCHTCQEERTTFLCLIKRLAVSCWPPLLGGRSQGLKHRKERNHDRKRSWICPIYIQLVNTNVDRRMHFFRSACLHWSEPTLGK